MSRKDNEVKTEKVEGRICLGVKSDAVEALFLSTQASPVLISTNIHDNAELTRRHCSYPGFPLPYNRGK